MKISLPRLPFSCMVVFLISLLSSCLDTSNPNPRSRIHYYVKLSEVNLTEADSVVLDYWVDDNRKPTHIVQTSVYQTAIFTIEVDESVALVVRVRVYADGLLVSVRTDEFFAGDRGIAPVLEPLTNPPQTKYAASVFDTLDLRKAYLPFGIRSCKFTSTPQLKDLGNCRISFPDSGAFDLVLTLKDVDGHELTENAGVTVLQGIPTVSLKCNRTLAWNLEEIFFTASASDPNGAAKDGQIILYEWDFDDDGTYEDSTKTNTNSIAYPDTSASHTYTVRVRVTDDDGNKESNVVSVKVEDREPALDSIKFVGSATPWTLVVNEPIWLLPPTISDPENNQIDSLWWDLNGDGIFETKRGSKDSILFKFDTITTRIFKAYSTDSFGKSDTVARAITSHAGFQDTRDGQWYGQVVIGDQTWMSENINVGRFTEEDHQQTNDTVIEKYCIGGAASTCSVFGGLYQWAEAMQFPSACNAGHISDPSCNRTIESQPQGICPKGWHIPTKSDWSELLMTIGDSATAGKRLRLNNYRSPTLLSTLKWDSLPAGWNPYGFSVVLRPGYYSAYFWEASASANYRSESYYRGFIDYYSDVRYGRLRRSDSLGVRCIKNRP